jgi:heme oxygenase
MESVSEHLKIHTKAAHDSVENSIDLVSCSTNLAAYTQLIKSFYGYYFEAEKVFNLFQKEFLGMGIDLKSREKINLLKDDLLSLGFSEKEIVDFPVCHKFPDITNITEAMSALYVLEGSTLGGQIIFKQLSNSGILVNGDGRGKFFKSYGANTRSMWMDFKKSLDSLSHTEMPKILATAKETFKSLEVWLLAHNG